MPRAARLRYAAYQTPEFFRDDWLNWHHDVERQGQRGAPYGGGAAECADYRFV